MEKMAFSVFSGSNYLINEKLFSFTFEALFMNSHIDSQFIFPWQIQGPTNLDKIKKAISPPSSPLKQSVRIRVQSKTCHVSITEKKGGKKGWLSKIVAINMFVGTCNACQTKNPKNRH